MIESHSTTVLAVRHNGQLVIAADGQVTVNNTVMKHGAAKIRSLLNGSVLVGFAGSAADGMALFERFETKLKEFGSQLSRAAVELAKEWRTDRALRRLEAMMIVADKSALYLLTGAGDVIEPDDGVLSIGSGSNFAIAAARALIKSGPNEISTRQIVETAMEIAASSCPYTNSNFLLEELSCE